MHVYLDRYVPEPNTGCWLWLGALNGTGGYGVVRYRGRQWYAHRAMYEELVGPIPDGLHIDHLCRVRCCVNPEHMEPVTKAENERRGLAGELTTHCPVGHPYSEANTYIRKKRPGRTGRRDCRACNRAGALRRYHRLHSRDPEGGE